MPNHTALDAAVLDYAAALHEHREASDRWSQHLLEEDEYAAILDALARVTAARSRLCDVMRQLGWRHSGIPAPRPAPPQAPCDMVEVGPARWV